MLGPWRNCSERWAASTQDFLSVFCIPTDIVDSFPIGLYLIYLEEKYRTHEYSELIPERLHLLAGRPVHVSTTWSAIWSPAMPFFGEIRKGTHLHFNTVTSMPTREGPRTSWPSMFASLLFGTILASAWPHFCSLVLVGWLALTLVRKRTEKSSGKVQDVTENWVVNQGWAGLASIVSKVREF